MEMIDSALSSFASFVWGMPLVVLLLGGGVWLLLISHAVPYRLIPHAISLLRGRADDDAAQGQLSHFQALSAALAGTIGLGNIAGVAVAVKLGGPGAIFWMWMTALVGVATKFFTGTLAVMYRGHDDKGQLRGGPMYVIREGLPRKYRPLAILFCAAGMIGCLPALQVNQLVETSMQLVLQPSGWDQPWMPLAIGFGLMLCCAWVVRDGVSRIGQFAGRVVPLMCLVYVLAVAGILTLNWQSVPTAFMSIFQQAFDPTAAGVGGLIGVIIIGVRRGLFSNEAGIGTEVMAHATARTAVPVREGIVAMLGPIIDTLFVCTATALALLVTDVASSTELTGASLTGAAFAAAYGDWGTGLLMVSVLLFGMTTLMSYWFYGAQCAVYLFGAAAERHYRRFYLASILVVSMLPLGAAINLIDGMYALMAVPTMTATLLLAPKVLQASREYRAQLRQGVHATPGRGQKNAA